MSASYKAKVIPFIKTKFGDSVKKAVCKICFSPTTKCHKKWQIAWVTTICVTTSHLRINCIHCLEWPAGNEIRYIFEIPQKHDKNKERIISHQFEQMQTQMFIFKTLRHYTVSFELRISIFKKLEIFRPGCDDDCQMHNCPPRQYKLDPNASFQMVEQQTHRR